ncbi:YciI family protein, partial [Saccharothrix sp. MB29]|nr:YciI family protein [Saccharothrix sp. MB29]
EGLYPSSRGARVFFDGDERTVVDGPFTETKELIAGFWLLDVKSLDECVEWVKRVPNTSGGHSQIEVRQVIESEDFTNAPQELVDRENELRAQQGYPTTRG